MRGYYTYKEIGELLGKRADAIELVVSRLNIPRVVVQNRAYVKKENLEDIELHYAPKIKNCDKSKIKIIERYLVFYSCRDVARALKTCAKKVGKIVKEWEESGEYIIVESSMNNPKKRKLNGE